MPSWTYLSTTAGHLSLPKQISFPILKLFQKSTSKKYFCYKVFLVSNDYLPPFSTLGHTSKIKMYHHENKKEEIIHGVITKMVYHGGFLDGHQVEFIIKPVLYFLKLSQTNRVWVNVTLHEVLNDILSAHFYLKINHKIAGINHPIDYLVQYNESDYVFFKHLLVQYDLSYFFEHDDEKCVLYIQSIKSPRFAQNTKPPPFTKGVYLRFPYLKNKRNLQQEVRESAHVHQCATIESIYDDPALAYRNTKGHYYIRHPFDQSNRPKGCASKAIPCMQYNPGLQFSLYPNTTVMLGFLNHETNTPFILGALSNQFHPSPVTSNNPYEYRITSITGHSLIFNDDPQNLKIELHTPFNSTNFTLSKEKINLEAPKGEVHLKSEKNIFKNAENILLTQAKNHDTYVEHNYSLISNSISIHAGNDFSHTTNENFNLDVKNNISIQSNEKITFHAKNNHEMLAKNNINMHASGKAHIYAKQIHLKGQKSIEMRVHDCSVSIKQNEITITAKNILIESPLILMKKDSWVS